MTALQVLQVDIRWICEVTALQELADHQTDIRLAGWVRFFLEKLPGTPLPGPLVPRAWSLVERGRGSAHPRARVRHMGRMACRVRS